tara:strand:+ start:401 stop:718 length:318 start_codon:yes stop_codon:yes gene_type:complete
MTNVQTAETIMQQLGGNKFRVMTGAKEIYAIENGVQFKIGRNESGANRVVITLNGMDTYDMKFQKVSMSRKTYQTTVKDKAESLGNYNDMLAGEFEKITGLYTSL